MIEEKIKKTKVIISEIVSTKEIHRIIKYFGGGAYECKAGM